MAQVLKEEVRRQILDSARDILIKKGYAGCTMRQIAEGTNITVGNLYRYFDSKAAIYEQIASTVIDKIDAVIIAESSGTISLKSHNNSTVAKADKATFKRIENGIIDIVPLLVKKYKKEVIILLHTSNEKNVSRNVVDLAAWAGQNLDFIYGTSGIGQYLAAAALYAIEQILTTEKDVDQAVEKIIFIIKLLAMKGDIK